MTKENSICSTGAPEEVLDRVAEIQDEERVEQLGTAYRGVKCITGEDSKLIFSDPTTAQLAEREMGRNPLDWLGYTPFAGEKLPLYLKMERDSFFGGEESRTFHKSLPADCNLYMLLAAVDEGIEVTGDYHHTFFEGWDICEAVHPFEGAILILSPILGS